MKSLRIAALMALCGLLGNLVWADDDNSKKGRSGGSSSSGQSSGGSSSGRSRDPLPPQSQDQGMGKSRGGGSSQSSGGGSQTRSGGGSQSSGGGSSTRSGGGSQSSGGSSSGKSNDRGNSGSVEPARGGGNSQSSDQGMGRGRSNGGSQSSGGAPTRSGGSQTSGGNSGKGNDRGTTGSIDPWRGSGNGQSGDQGTGKGRSNGGSQTSGGNSSGKGNDRGTTGRTDPWRGDQGNSGSKGNSNGRDPIGRVDRGTQDRPDRVRGTTGSVPLDQDFLNKARRSGASGNSGSGSSNNVNRSNSQRGVRSFDVGRAPVDIFGGSLQNQVRREDRVRIVNNNNCRTGYYHYYNNWNDDWFWFRNYVCNPFQSNYRVVCSPWYYYPHLPAYINYSCVRVIRLDYGNWQGVDYRYYDNDDYYGNNRYRDRDDRLDDALYDLQRAFERTDKRSLSRLVPNRGTVAIYIDGRYEYSMDDGDYYEMMLDTILGTRTLRYEIVDVETYRGEAEVRARHDYIDPWGGYRSVNHWYRLERDRDEYVITRFGTSYRN